MSHNALESSFDVVVGSESGLRVNRTKAECINLALEKAGCKDKSRSCMVGDRFIDAIGAAEAGVDFVAALYSATDRSEVDDCRVSCFAESFRQAVDYLLG